ncbi:MAG: hypothetical protein JKY98_08000 [Gammaproteobacteria bacterium]|nr:hypothetical protein [Gammaproteobacteria bacterium]
MHSTAQSITMYRLLLILLLCPALTSSVLAATSYDGYRWFQVEVSIFSNEFPEDRNSEFWSPERLTLAYPERIRAFANIADYFQIEKFEQKIFTDPGNGETDIPDPQQLAARVGPFPAAVHGNLRLPDLAREPYLLLPPALSDFQTTNARLERSPTNRLLFHGLWRQPVVNKAEAQALMISGGRQYNGHHELEGSITIRFNRNQDRVVIDANIWLSQFSSTSNNEKHWPLPRTPSSDSADLSTGIEWQVNHIVQMKQSRDMRSTEFHYLDHPSLGIVVSVLPYDLPPRVRLDSLDRLDQAADAAPGP